MSGHYKFVLIIEGRTAVRPSGDSRSAFLCVFVVQPYRPGTGCDKIEDRGTFSPDLAYLVMQINDGMGEAILWRLGR